MSLQLKVKITKDILRASRMCGWNDNRNVGKNFAIAVAIRDIFPLCSVGKNCLFFHRYPDSTDIFDLSPLPSEATSFIDQFDTSSPEERMKMGETELEITIPDSVV